MCQQLPIDKIAVLSMYDMDGVTTVPVPGRRCPACLERGQTVWVIPGKCCPTCGTPVN
ncbi:hypothetical protein BU23DRAFT_557834 [Bimuria novae-zelandiae CBS 107.79]|uniref:Uncharacterized protein n=1 Tax=Bimuria novae-zelandiae CBS 107.79 TaxID=1447943 RepID=A0A6A5V734_9PLEO|nr:hypothetical protein BU23DRAFT_557834 [Bimuria novae-zelandiae CBS 107.79]